MDVLSRILGPGIGTAGCKHHRDTGNMRLSCGNTFTPVSRFTRGSSRRLELALCCVCVTTLTDRLGSGSSLTAEIRSSEGLAGVNGCDGVLRQKPTAPCSLGKGLIGALTFCSEALLVSITVSALELEPIFSLFRAGGEGSGASWGKAAMPVRMA